MSEYYQSLQRAICGDLTVWRGLAAETGRVRWVRKLLGRFMGFSSLPVLSALMPLLALPVVARIGGVDDWTALTLGQAVGVFVASIGNVGWTVLGTPQVAQASDEYGRTSLYRRSFSTRIVVLGAATPLTIAACWILAPHGVFVLAATFAVAASLAALSLNWYAVGIASPRMIAVYDLLPKLLLTLASVPLVLVSGHVAWYAAALCAAPLIGLAALHRRLFGRLAPRWIGWSAVRSDITDRRAAWLVEMTGSLYSSSPVPIAAGTSSPPDAAAYASSDKVYRYALLPVIALGNAMQGWVLEARGRSQRRRQISAIAAQLLLGFVGMTGLALMGEQVSKILFGEAVAGEGNIFFWLGVSYFAISASTPLIRNILVPARREKIVLGATALGAVAGVTLMLFLSTAMGTVGIAVGLAMSEMLVLVICALGCLRVGLVVGPDSDTSNR